MSSAGIFFDVGEYVVLLTNRTVITDLPILPKPSEEFNTTMFPGLIFQTPGIYSVSEISGQETLMELILEMRSRYQKDDILKAQQQKRILKISESRKMAQLLTLTNNRIREWFFKTFTTLTIITLIAVVIYQLINHSGDIRKMLGNKYSKM